jgi:hypothetical protein
MADGGKRRKTKPLNCGLKGESLFVVTAEVNASMTRMLVPKFERVRTGDLIKKRALYCRDMSGVLSRIDEPCWTRTSDPLLKRQMLCRLS